MTDSSLKIPKNPFNSSQVKFSRIMHVKAHLLNNISNVWLGKSKILEGSSKTAIVCRISDRGTISSRNFGTSVNWCATSVIPALLSMSMVYCCCDKKRPPECCFTEIPRK